MSGAVDPEWGTGGEIEPRAPNTPNRQTTESCEPTARQGGIAAHQLLGGSLTGNESSVLSRGPPPGGWDTNALRPLR
jgi:hypothetical protein